MKTTITITVDADIKEKAMHIIQNELNDSISNYVNEKLKEVVKNNSNSINI